MNSSNFVVHHSNYFRMFIRYSFMCLFSPVVNEEEFLAIMTGDT